MNKWDLVKRRKKWRTGVEQCREICSFDAFEDFYDRYHKNNWLFKAIGWDEQEYVGSQVIGNILEPLYDWLAEEHKKRGNTKR